MGMPSCIWMDLMIKNGKALSRDFKQQPSKLVQLISVNESVILKRLPSDVAGKSRKDPLYGQRKIYDPVAIVEGLGQGAAKHSGWPEHAGKYRQYGCDARRAASAERCSW